MTVALLERDPAHTLLSVPWTELRRTSLPGKNAGILMDMDSALQQALAWHRNGEIARAEAVYQGMHRKHPGRADLLNLLGVCRLQQGDPEGSLPHLMSALRLSPAGAETHANLAQALMQLGRSQEAVPHLESAAAMLPGEASLHFLLGDALLAQGNAQAALAAYDRAIGLQPALLAAHNNRGNALLALGAVQAALQAFDAAHRIDPAHPAPFSGRAAALLELHRSSEALAASERALELAPDLIDARFNCGNALLDLQRLEEACEAYRQVLQHSPSHLKARHNLGIAFQLLQNHAEAGGHFEQLLRECPEYPQVPGHLLASRLHCCDWRDLEALRGQAQRAVEAGVPAIDPFTLLCVCDQPALQRACAELYVAREIMPPAYAPAWTARMPGERIRLAYVSADLHDHATARLLAELIELHDRERFAVMGVSLGPDDGSAMRRRLIEGFDEFIDARELDDAQVVERMRAARIDIAVDLKGHTAGSRPGVFARRPAPVQVAYLGYPGTSGASFIDYLIADEVTVPPAQRNHYTEHIAYLPGSYQVNDRRRPRPSTAVSRAQAGLPAQGFVFCCFNNSYKILPGIFDHWMNILRSTEGSTLWLLEDSEVARRNLQIEAQRRGIDSRRLVFAPRVPLPEHLARHQLADLFLDTLPVNAHTTASDALWAGLPVLTSPGSGFAARVAASLLYAVGLPELVAGDLVRYEELAVELAGNPGRLRAIRELLARNVTDAALFDTDRFRLEIEAIYEAMWRRHLRGETPADLHTSQLGTANEAAAPPAR